MYRRVATICAAMLILVCVGSVSATNVGGTVYNTTWTKAGSPWRVVSKVTVVSGYTLTIEPGVDVLFDVDDLILVQGSIHAIGTESDSIRFLAGSASQFAGLRFATLDSNTIHYARISDGNADVTNLNGSGGAIRVLNSGTRLGMAHCEIRDNQALKKGGGIYVGGGAALTLDRCVIRRNTSTEQGGGLYVEEGSFITLDHCTIAGNTGLSGSQVIDINATFTVRNSIVWGETTGISVASVMIGRNPFTMEYSCITNLGGGTGNIDADPLFADSAGGDYRLTALSPCIDAGDRTTPKDLDGTHADMGAFAFDQPTIRGEINTTTWTTAGSPYVVVSPCTIATGATLTVNAGVEVLLYDGVQFVVEGTLSAEGTSDDSVRFLPHDEAPWKSLKFASSDTSTLKYTRLSGSYTGAIGDGGAIKIVDSGTRLGMYNCVVSGNSSGTGSGGGIMAGMSTRLTCEDTRFENNSTLLVGGAVSLAQYCIATFDRCEFIGNESTGSSRGGALQAGGATLLARDCVFTDNTAAAGGAVSLMYESVAAFEKCIFVNNSSITTAGAIHVDTDAAGSFTQCDIIDNEGSPLVETYGGGGIYNAGETSVNSCIVRGNLPDQIKDTSGDMLTVDYSNIEDGISGTGNIDADPLFTSPDDFHLLENTPCMDTGDPALPVDPDGSRADMGVYPYTLYGDVTLDRTISSLDAVQVLKYVVRYPVSVILLAGDVTGNGGLSALDAACILSRVLNPDYLFPVELGVLTRPTRGAKRMVSWRHDGSAWVLDVSDSQTIHAISATLTVSVPNPEITGPDAMAVRTEGNTVKVAGVWQMNPVGGLIRVTLPMTTQPVLESLQVNEEQIVTDRPVPSSVILMPNAPNPFNPTTTIKYMLPGRDFVDMAVYSMTGQRIRTLVTGQRDAGFHSVVWNGRDDTGRAAGSGVYICRMRTTKETLTTRMVMTK
jgi:hypothetical protein